MKKLVKVPTRDWPAVEVPCARGQEGDWWWGITLNSLY